MNVDNPVLSSFSAVRPDGVNVWLFPENAIKDKWYVGLYFNDSTPYVIRFDGALWRDNSLKNNVVAIPMRVIPIPPPPVIKKTQKNEE